MFDATFPIAPCTIACREFDRRNKNKTIETGFCCLLTYHSSGECKSFIRLFAGARIHTMSLGQQPRGSSEMTETAHVPTRQNATNNNVREYAILKSGKKTNLHSHFSKLYNKLECCGCCCRRCCSIRLCSTWKLNTKTCLKKTIQSAVKMDVVTKIFTWTTIWRHIYEIHHKLR